MYTNLDTDVNMFVLVIYVLFVVCFFFKQKTAYDMRISDWSSDVCSSDLVFRVKGGDRRGNPLRTPTRVHKKPEYWLEEFQENQDRLSRSEERRVGKECVSTCSSRV